jgi:hypothetical protein
MPIYYFTKVVIGRHFIAQNDNGGGGTNARIPATSGFMTLPVTGTYTILANSFAAGESGNYTLYLGTDVTPTSRKLFDFDGDGKADVSVFRPSNGSWYLNQSTNGFTGVQFGISTDKPVAAITTATVNLMLLFIAQAPVSAKKPTRIRRRCLWRCE